MLFVLGVPEQPWWNATEPCDANTFKASNTLPNRCFSMAFNLPRRPHPGHSVHDFIHLEADDFSVCLLDATNLP